MAGFEIRKNNTDAFRAALDDAVERCLTILGMKAEGYAKKNITQMRAVDTGNLRNSITFQTQEKEVLIGTNVEYAPYVELGTRKMRARPFLTRAILDHGDEYKQIIDNELRNG